MVEISYAHCKRIDLVMSFENRSPKPKQFFYLPGADCPQLSAPAHGNTEGYRRETGSTVRVSCDQGYKVDPDSSSFRTCQANNQWSGADPVCTRKNKLVLNH